MDKPLAIKLAPQSIKDVLGQEHLIGKNKILSNLVKNKKLFSMILYGEPGIGKTSIANAIVNDIGITYRSFNATINNKKDFDIIVEEAKLYGGMVLIMDEIHRLNKDKQDLLLPCLESGLITLIGLTTANPYHKINPAIRSRCQIFKLNPLTPNDIYKGLKKACSTPYLEGIKIDKKSLEYIANMAKSDLRFAYNLLEISYYANKEHFVDLDIIKSINPTPVIALDKNESNYYDTLSGLQKSIRGSDVNAALHYLAKLLLAEDLDSIARRLSVICYEDIGLANPSMGPKVESAINLSLLVGLPEAQIILSNIVIELALSPKSNTACLAITAAINDLKSKNIGEMPNYLKSPYLNYKYPHNYKHSLVKQEYLPTNLVGSKYYLPKESSKYEHMLKETMEKIEKFKKEDL